MSDSFDPELDYVPEWVHVSAVRPTVGGFRFWFTSQQWEWSPEVFRMHGYTPGEIEPTTELLLAHKHPDDRHHVAEAITRSIDQGEPFSSRHRFLDAGGDEHTVMVVADRLFDDTGRPVGTSGFYIDLTDELATAERDTLTARMPAMVEARAVIEQAKGVLMHLYRINAEQAFKVLVWRSQETNTKLRDLAAQLIAELDRIPPSQPSAVSAFDHILLTVHERIPPA
ncbi:PAS and ANTAR domain-containing protein [Nocardia sp. alder85J]|uniref:PAS and ANTAR domain-containing protein n=1 Tax=Nocardia sp. alder85J TaxID=2862949 RepID=UPI001CD61FA0|nr:PAS and ANTAR domain-containing protein [Nocardia sp. alder85J]MCX4098579.1 PAS and ANTAR domain-containing protein [Nocardia sp. alder85J]